MQKIRYFTSCLLVVVLWGCSSTKPAPPAPPSIISDFPRKPDLVHYKTPPVIKKVESDYLVTGDLVTNATLLTDYFKRIDLWKDAKNVK